MINNRKIEIFSAGCTCCEEVVSMVRQEACPSCEVEVLDMNQSEVADKAKQYGIASVPAVVIDGTLAGCCSGRSVDLEALRSAGLGVPMS